MGQNQIKIPRTMVHVFLDTFPYGGRGGRGGRGRKNRMTQHMFNINYIPLYFRVLVYSNITLRQVLLGFPCP